MPRFLPKFHGRNVGTPLLYIRVPTFSWIARIGRQESSRLTPLPYQHLASQLPAWTGLREMAAWETTAIHDGGVWEYPIADFRPGRGNMWR